MTLPQDPKERATTTSLLHGSLRLNFSGESARERAAITNRPNKVYRWSHEKNGTLASNVSRVKHVVHADNQDLILQDHNAFQGRGTLQAPLDFTKERIMKHLDARMTGPNPTPFISTTSRLALAEKKVKHLHDKTRKVPRCLVVTSLDISKIVPATLTANMTTTTNGHTTEHKDTDHIEETVYDDIEIPIWVLFQDDYEGPAHERPDCEVNDVLDAGGIFWFSVNELKVSDLRVWAGDDHRGEWLAVSSIPKSLIVRAMPFDGMVLHTSKTTEVIQARGSPEPYLWNHDNVCWDHMPGHTKHYDLADYRPYRLSKQGDKRIYDDAKIAAAITENIMTNFKRFRRANNNADARPDAAHDFEDVAARTPENMSIEVVITDPLLARHRFVLRPQDYES